MATKMSPGRLSERRGVHKIAHIDPPSPVSLRKSHEQSKSFDYTTKSFLSSSSSSSAGSISSAASSTTSSSFAFSATESAFSTPYTDLPPPIFASSPMPVSTPATSVCQDDWVKPVFPASFTMTRSSSKQSLGPLTSRSFAFGRGRHSPGFNSDGSSKFPRLTPSSSDDDLHSQPLRRQKSFPALMMSYSMPPTPPSRGELVAHHNSGGRSPMDTRPSSHGSSSSQEAPPRTPVDKSEDLYDPDTLSDPSAPASPSATEGSSSGRTSRRATVFNKIIPQKLRVSMRRRSSASGSQAPPPIPPVSTMPSLPQQAPIAKEDLESYFASKLPLSVHHNASSSVENIPRTYTETPDLPPLEVPFLSPSESNNQSPLSIPPHLASDGCFLEVAPPTPNIPEAIYSPLPPPTVTPLVSPTIPPTVVNCATLNSVLQFPLESTLKFPHQVVPDVIDPSSPAVFAPGHRYTASLPTMPVTADSLADMIERMRMEDHAYAVTERHFKESGWTTKEEIASIRQQRIESKLEWQRKIMESKRVLVDIRKAEVCTPNFNMDTYNSTLYSPSYLEERNDSLTQVLI